MNSLLPVLARFAGRHWLRIIIVGGALLLLSQKQINFNVRLGGSTPPVTEPARSVGGNTAPTIITEAESPLAQAGTSLLGGFSLFGEREATLAEKLSRQEAATVEAFIRRFSNVAQAEQEKFGIPASITLANALLYSRAGTAEAVSRNNSYFQSSRHYENAWTSFRDHSLTVTSGPYAALNQFGPNDYRRWAAGLEELGYNGTDDLAAQLVSVIDRWQLFRFD